MGGMKAIQVTKPGGEFQLVERPIPEPGPHEVRLKVQACGICHSDMYCKEGVFPWVTYPRVPGHEVIGVIDKAGSEVRCWKSGERVGVGWHGGHCFSCNHCRHGDFVTCAKQKISGLSIDGGYAEYMVVGAEALALVPPELDALAAAPLLCAGVTTFNALRNSGAKWGQVVAIQGIGGLGHLGLQYARRMGFRTVAVSNSPAKRDLALQLGAHVYIDASAQSPAAELQKMGGARVILATAPNSRSMEPLVDALGVNGRLIVVGVGPDPITIMPRQLIPQRKAVSGWPSGRPIDSEETLSFSALTGVKAMVESFPLEKAAEGYARMMSNQARFRAVLAMA